MALFRRVRGGFSTRTSPCQLVSQSERVLHNLKARLQGVGTTPQLRPLALSATNSRRKHYESAPRARLPRAVVRRPQVGKLGEQIVVRADPIPVTFPFVMTARKASGASSLGVRPLSG